MKAGDVHALMRALPISADPPLGRTMILAPHADDESLGCGGLIAELCGRGLPPLVLVVTDGTGSHPNSRLWPAERLRALREDETLQATAALGLPASNVGFMRLRDTAAPHDGPDFEAACTFISARLRDCDTLLSPWGLDPHCDHEAVQKMARRVARDKGLRLLSYPVWGWLIAPDTQIAPALPMRGFRLDISRHLQAKGRAIRLHASQYSDLITDDPEGFRLPQALLSVFEQPCETFLETEHEQRGELARGGVRPALRP
jgi:LmbE family N-acetylglucosaminyl deacetylase